MKIQETIWAQYAELGRNALDARQLPLAEKMFSAAVEEAQRGKGDLFRLAESYFGLAQTYHLRQQAVLAVSYYKKAMLIFEKDSLKFGTQLANTWDNIAVIALAQNDLPKAYTFLRKAVTMYEKIFGKESEVLSPRLLRLGYVYTQFKEFDKALACYDRAKALSKGKVQVSAIGQSPIGSTTLPSKTSKPVVASIRQVVPQVVSASTGSTGALVTR